MRVWSDSFENGEFIPKKYTCDGDNINPSLFWDSVDGAKSYAIYIYDPDIPDEVKVGMGIDIYNHFFAYNIPGYINNIKEGEINTVGQNISNSSGYKKYIGPCPPANLEPKIHRYFFKVFALPFEEITEHIDNIDEFLSKIKNDILDEGEFFGKYSRAGS